MRRLAIAVSLAALAAAAAPVAAQSYQDQQRWDAAQARYSRETQIYQQERDRYIAAQQGYRGYQGQGDPRGQGYPQGQQGYYQGQQGYYGGQYRSAPPPPPQGYSDDRDENGYDAARYYRDGSGYQERRLAPDDRVYRGSDGRYYCKRSDGTTGLIVGAVSGGVLGNVIDGGHSRAAGTLIGGALGAIIGKTVDQQNSISCR